MPKKLSRTQPALPDLTCASVSPKIFEQQPHRIIRKDTVIMDKQ